MKRILFAFLCMLLLVGCFDGVNLESKQEETPKLITPGSEFSPGGYIEFEGVDISYDGDLFSVTNNREDAVRISVMVVGVRSDGEYDLIQIPAFNGTDETQYQMDLEENGWAVSQKTNMVRPDETLAAELSIFDFGDDFPPPDIDKDGYYDIVFCLHPQESEETIQASTDDPTSAVYKLKAK